MTQRLLGGRVINNQRKNNHYMLRSV